MMIGMEDSRKSDTLELRELGRLLVSSQGSQLCRGRYTVLLPFANFRA